MIVGHEVGAAPWLVLANCSLPSGGSGRRAGRVCHHSIGLGPLLDVVRDPFHEGGVLDAGDPLDGTAALVTVRPSLGRSG